MKEENPYRPPESGDDPAPAGPALASGCKGAFSGCLLGGIAIPMIAFLLCVVFLGDTGGPGFWVFLAVGSALVGTLIGFLFGSVTKP